MYFLLISPSFPYIIIRNAREGFEPFLLPLYRYLVDALLVASALKLGLEVLVHNLAGHVLVDEAS